MSRLHPFILLSLASGLAFAGTQGGAPVPRALPFLVASLIAVAFAVHRAASARFAGLALFVSAALQLPLAVDDPRSSDDLYRYLWEGRVLAAGESPWRFPPESPRLEALRDERIHPRINHPEIATIYPPLAEGLFVLAEVLGGTPASWKLLLLALELGGALLILGLAARRQRSPLPAVLFLWHPLIFLEVAEGGHVDAAGSVALLVALPLFAESRGVVRGVGAAIAALSVLIKPAALPALAFFARRRSGLVGVGTAGLLGLGSVALLFQESPGRLAITPGVSATLLTRQGLSTMPAPEWRETGREEIEVSMGRAWSRALPASGGRACLLPRAASDGGLAVVAESRGRIEPLEDATRDASALIGRYAIGVLGASGTRPWGWLEFDGQERVRVTAPDGTATTLGYSTRRDGRFELWQRESPRTLRATLAPAKDRAVLRLVIADWPGFGRGVEAVALRAQDGPLTGSRQYGGRWAGFSILHAPLEKLLGGRHAIPFVGAALLLVLVAILWWRRIALPLATVATTGLAVALLPVVYPWYFLWILGPAVHVGNERARGGLLALLALAPLIHLA